MTDPDLPARVSSGAAQRLAGWLGERAGGEWRVEVLSDPVAAGQSDGGWVLGRLAEHRARRGWDCAVAVTDLPLLSPFPVVAETSRRRACGLVSLPALGGVAVTRRLRCALAGVLDDLLGLGSGSGPSAAWGQSWVAPLRRAEGEHGTAYRRPAGRGWPRLVAGMVRANRPWRLITGLSSALAAGLATSAFGISSSTIWQIGDQIATTNQVAAVVTAIALLVLWLIATHRLWERGSEQPTRRRLAALYNLSTVVTLLVGISLLYITLFALNLGIAALLVPRPLLSSSLGHPDGLDGYLALAWGFTTMGSLAGALGTSLESDQAIRQAAYGYREQQRRSPGAQHSTTSGPVDTPPSGTQQATAGGDNGGETKQQLYDRARRAAVAGRSRMTKGQLRRALRAPDRGN